MIIYKHENNRFKKLEDLIAVNLELTAHTAITGSATTILEAVEWTLGTLGYRVIQYEDKTVRIVLNRDFEYCMLTAVKERLDCLYVVLNRQNESFDKITEINLMYEYTLLTLDVMGVDYQRYQNGTHTVDA